MKNVGTQVYAFENGVSTMYTLPNDIINDDMQKKSYIVYTASRTSFDITMYLGGTPTPRRTYYLNHDNDVKQIRQFMDLLNSSLREIFNADDIANIYELITSDILELIKLIYPDNENEVRIKYHYFEADDGNVYDIKVMSAAITFMVSVTNLTLGK